MPYLPDLNAYLHQSSLLLQAYPNTTRVTTKYSLPRKPTNKPPKPSSTTPSEPSAEATERKERERLAPAARLTLKTFEPGSGICLKYQTDKAAEVGRLVNGLGRLAAGEIIEMPAPNAVALATLAEDKTDMDESASKTGSGAATPRIEEGKGPPQGQGGGAAKGKKKKGKK